jgi:anaerobic ribonucleoside-triphosphate reductase
MHECREAPRHAGAREEGAAMDADRHRADGHDPSRGVREVIKRDGQRVPFDPARIESAILKAGKASGEFDREEAGHLAAQVLKVVQHRSWSDSPSVEQIQDIVEQTLIEADYFLTARKYIVYREQRKRVRDDQKVFIDAIGSVNEYLQEADWRVHANANQGYSLGGLILNVAGKVTANYWLSEVYPAEVGQAHRRGDLHIHDLDMLCGYCAGWSLRDLLYQGFNGVPGKVEAAPAKHMSSAVGQMVNFLGTLQNEWAGAQAFSSFDTYLAPYIRADRMRYGEVKQCIQEFVYNLNVPSRWGTQTPFTNITLDWTCPEDLRDQKPRMGDEEADFTYGELEDEMAMINRAFLEVMTTGDWRGRVFTFPIPTYNITRDFPWDHPNTTACSR